MAVSLSFSSSLLLSSLSLLINVSLADQTGSNKSTVVVVTNPDTRPPLPPPTPPPHPNFSSFKPSIAAVVGVLITVFSVTFLLLLYAKHCNRRNGAVYVHHHHRFDGRKNSGIDRTVIESLPVFRFGALSGDKEGLECAVCLARFEPTEVLRLLPKCKHAFHVECVDTWLDAHSTCPLCRYRVDPEDILLIGDCNPWFEIRLSHRGEEADDREVSCTNSTDTGSEHPPPQPGRIVDPGFWVRRISGRHSSAGEQASRVNESTTSCRRSLDSSLRDNRNGGGGVDAVSVGCFERAQRKDGLLLLDGAISDRKSFERRFEHRIIISAATGNFTSGTCNHNQRDQRWSDVVRPSDLLYLRSEMILSQTRKTATATAATEEGVVGSGRVVSNGRSVSEITSVERLWRRESDNSNRHRRQRQAAAVVSRWLAWAVRPHRTTVSSFP